MPAGVEQLVSAVKRGRFWSEDDVVNFLQTQSAFSTDRVMCGCPVHDLPLELVVFVLGFQSVDVGTESGLVFIFS